MEGEQPYLLEEDKSRDQSKLLTDLQSRIWLSKSQVESKLRKSKGEMGKEGHKAITNQQKKESKDTDGDGRGCVGHKIITKQEKIIKKRLLRKDY